MKLLIIYLMLFNFFYHSSLTLLNVDSFLWTLWDLTISKEKLVWYDSKHKCVWGGGGIYILICIKFYEANTYMQIYPYLCLIFFHDYKSEGTADAQHKYIYIYRFYSALKHDFGGMWKEPKPATYFLCTWHFNSMILRALPFKIYSAFQKDHIIQENCGIH